MQPKFFSNQSDFRKWLEINHLKEKELLVGFYKIDSGKPSMTWSESVDQALCFGWIDSKRNSIDKDSYQIRFTHRKPSSNWSTINLKKIEELTIQGLMSPAGLAIFEKRKVSHSEIYSYENEDLKFPVEYEKLFKANLRACDYFESLAPSYRKISIRWVMSAKQESTRLNRLTGIIADCEKGICKFK
jgi:uncharacterized protein YdeI (YjbR/CyaY-like superfamily)